MALAVRHALFLLVLYGCATESLEERAITCKPVESEECQSLQRKADEKAKGEIKCPPNHIIYKDTWNELYCVSREDFYRWRTWNF